MRAHRGWMLLMLVLVLSMLVLTDVRDIQAQIPLANHYKCYEILNPPTISIAVNLVDQFVTQGATVVRPRFLCNPVRKNGSSVPNPNLHYVCYEIQAGAIPTRTVSTTNQFHTLTFKVQQPRLLCLPSSKTLVQ